MQPTFVENDNAREPSDPLAMSILRYTLGSLVAVFALYQVGKCCLHEKEKLDMDKKRVQHMATIGLPVNPRFPALSFAMGRIGFNARSPEVAPETQNTLEEPGPHEQPTTHREVVESMEIVQMTEMQAPMIDAHASVLRGAFVDGPVSSAKERASVMNNAEVVENINMDNISGDQLTYFPAETPVNPPVQVDSPAIQPPVVHPSIVSIDQRSENSSYLSDIVNNLIADDTSSDCNSAAGGSVSDDADTDSSGQN